ncbi:MAG: GNAT family N-acetyltransferase [Chloroflexota bacterium]
MNKIRSADPEKDYKQLALLLNKVWNIHVTADWLKNGDERMARSPVRQRSIFHDNDGNVVGYSMLLQTEGDIEDDSFYIDVIVDPEKRQQGIGKQLYDEAFATAKAHGAREITVECYDNCEPCQSFIKSRDFTLSKHMFESRVDLQTFDPNQFAHLINRVEAQGVRFFSLADVGDTPEWRHKLYEVNHETYLDDPGFSGKFSFDEFNHLFETADWFVPEGQLMAAVGETVVGLSALGYQKTENFMYNNMTGVTRPYRGQKIAQALKIVGLNFAKSFGADSVRTHNDSNNEAMLSINRKLGYKPLVGTLRFELLL